MIKQLLLVLMLIALTTSFCKISGCNTCTTSIDTATSVFVESCSACNTGYVLNPTTKLCDFDIGLVIGVAIVAVLIVVVQITCFCICRAYFEHEHKRKIQFTLDQIFEQLQEQRKDPQINRQLQAVYEKFHNEDNKCLYCEKNPEHKPNFKAMEKRIKEKEKRQYEEGRKQNDDENATGQEGSSEQGLDEIPPHPFGPTIKVKCQHQHLYHLQCLKKHLLDCPEGQRQCLCGGHDITPFYMVCVQCKLKHRLLKLELNNTNIQQIEDYICSICFRRKKNQEQKKKWWKKLC